MYYEYGETCKEVINMLKKILGILIFVLLGVLFFGALVFACGWAAVLILMAIAFALGGLIKLGIWLLAD